MSDYCKHDHELCGSTDCNQGHSHRIKDVESKEPKSMDGGLQHIHYYEGKTSKDDKHRHKICYYTGPAIPAACKWGHYHYFYGVTSCDHEHTHFYRGMTDIEKND